MTHNVLVIGGPTASGKSSLALACADIYNGVVVNADSMQLYDALHVLTAHPSLEEQKQHPHKLYGVLHPDDICSAAIWRDMALTEIKTALDNGQTPILVGGTGFYIKALLSGLSPIPDITASIRQDAIDAHAEHGNDGIYALLEENDPDIAKVIDKANTQRLIRAWEVFIGTGKPLSYWQNMPLIAPPDHLSFFYATLLPDREDLYANCEKRFDMMMDLDALEEVKALDLLIKNKEVKETAPLTKALGFVELRDYLNEKMTLDETIQKSVQRTRNYAKRQMTWFRNQAKSNISLKSAQDIDIIRPLFEKA